MLVKKQDGASKTVRDRGTVTMMLAIKQLNY